MSTFAQHFELVDPGYWHWMTERPLMRDARVKFDLSVYGCWEEEGEDDDPNIEVVVDDLSHGSESISACHEVAWDHIVSNRDRIEGVLRKELLEHHRRAWTGFQRDVTDGTEGWEEIRELVDWDDESAIDHLYALQSIMLGPEVRDDCSIATFHFSSSWDTEHGVDVPLFRDEVVN
jgi:hypothetical protein